MSDLEPPFILDTNALTDLTDERKPRHPAAMEAFARIIGVIAAQGVDSHDVLAIPTTVIFESVGGLYSNGATTRLARVREFIKAYLEIIDFSEETATHAGKLYAIRPHHNDKCDLMILASALEEAGSLITHDAKLVRFAAHAREQLSLESTLTCGWAELVTLAEE